MSIFPKKTPEGRLVLSRAVTRLEARLGRQLLQRTSRLVGLTDAGRLYLEQMRTALGLLDDAEREVQGQDGPLTGRAIRLGQLPARPELPARHPQAHARLPSCRWTALAGERRVTPAAA